MRREAPPKPRPPRADRDREKEAASAAGGAAGAFLYRLDSKTGGEPRSLTHEVAARAAAACLLVRRLLTHPTPYYTPKKEALTKPKKWMTRAKSR